MEAFMLTEKTFDTGEIVINFAEGEAAGPPLVMLHGSTLRWQSFGDLIPVLEQSWHIYACDLRGHGKSGRAISGYRFGDFVPDTIAFVERFIGQPIVLVGFSTGAMVTLGVAARLPKLIRAIVLLDPPLRIRNSSIPTMEEAYEWFSWVNETLTSTRTIEEIVARCKERTPELQESDAQSEANMVHSIDPESVAYVLNERNFERFDLEQILPQVACPALLVRGEPELGGGVRDTDVALLQAHIPHVTTIQIRDIGHGIIWEQPGKMTLEHVTQFLNSL